MEKNCHDSDNVGLNLQKKVLRILFPGKDVRIKRKDREKFPCTEYFWRILGNRKFVLTPLKLYANPTPISSPLTTNAQM